MSVNYLIFVVAHIFILWSSSFNSHYQLYAYTSPHRTPEKVLEIVPDSIVTSGLGFGSDFYSGACLYKDIHENDEGIAVSMYGTMRIQLRSLVGKTKRFYVGRKPHPFSGYLSAIAQGPYNMLWYSLVASGDRDPAQIRAVTMRGTEMQLLIRHSDGATYAFGSPIAMAFFDEHLYLIDAADRRVYGVKVMRKRQRLTGIIVLRTAAFERPTALIADKNGFIVADSGKGRIFEYDRFGAQKHSIDLTSQRYLEYRDWDITGLTMAGNILFATQTLHRPPVLPLLKYHTAAPNFRIIAAHRLRREILWKHEGSLVRRPSVKNNSVLLPPLFSPEEILWHNKSRSLFILDHIMDLVELKPAGNWFKNGEIGPPRKHSADAPADLRDATGRPQQNF